LFCSEKEKLISETILILQGDNTQQDKTRFKSKKSIFVNYQTNGLF